MCFSRAEESLGSVTAMMGSLREATSSCCGGGWGVVFVQTVVGTGEGRNSELTYSLVLLFSHPKYSLDFFRKR